MANVNYYPLDDLFDFFTNNPARGSTFYTLGIRDFERPEIELTESSHDETR